MRAWKIVRSCGIPSRHPPPCLVMFDSLLGTAIRHAFENGVVCDPRDHWPTPPLPLTVFASRDPALVQPVCHRSVVESLAQAAEPLSVNFGGRRIQRPIGVRRTGIWLYVPVDWQRRCPAKLLKPVHRLLLDPLRCMRTMSDMVAAGLNGLLLPIRISGIDAVVWCDYAHSVVHGDPA